MEQIRKRKGILLLKGHDESREIDFELEYLNSLTVKERFLMMEQKNREMKQLLYQNDHRRTPEIIKRK
jgi:hypothetical protein